MDITKLVLAGQNVLIAGGVASGKTQTLAQLINNLVPSHYYPRHVAAVAVTRGSVASLQAAVTPLVEVSTVYRAARQATGDHAIICADKRDLIFQRRGFVARHLDLLRQVGNIGDTRADRRCLREARTNIGAALRLEARARRAGGDVLEQWSAAPGQLAPAFVAEVAERYQDFKQEFRLFDSTDLQLSAQADPEVRVAVVDDAEDLSRADLDFLARAYPNATFVFAGNPAMTTRTWEDLVPLRSLPHAVTVELGDPHRVVERWTIESHTAYAGLVPANVGDDVLIVLGGRSRFVLKRWFAWCIEAGFAFAVNGARVLDKMTVRDIAALWQCDQGDEVQPSRLDRLARAVGEPEGVNICARDFPGWTDWRGMARAGGYPEAMIDYAERMLARYGTLNLSEIGATPRITTLLRCKGLTADVAIVDGFSLSPRPGESEELHRARWTLACSRARRRLIVLQHESNARHRQPVTL